MTLTAAEIKEKVKAGIDTYEIRGVSMRLLMTGKTDDNDPMSGLRNLIIPAEGIA
jgi:hypothetical protein